MSGESRWKILGLTVAAEGGLAVAALLLGWLFGQQPWTFFWWDPQAWRCLSALWLLSLRPPAWDLRANLCSATHQRL